MNLIGGHVWNGVASPDKVTGAVVENGKTRTSTVMGEFNVYPITLSSAASDAPKQLNYAIVGLTSTFGSLPSWHMPLFFYKDTATGNKLVVPDATSLETRERVISVTCIGGRAAMRVIERFAIAPYALQK